MMECPTSRRLCETWELLSYTVITITAPSAHFGNLSRPFHGMAQLAAYCA